MNFIEDLWASLFSSEQATADETNTTVTSEASITDEKSCPRQMKTVWNHQRLSDMLEGRRFGKTSKDAVGRNLIPVLGESIRQVNESRDLKTNNCVSDSDILREKLKKRDNLSNIKRSTVKNCLDISIELPDTAHTDRKSVSISSTRGNLNDKKVGQSDSIDSLDDSTTEDDTEASQENKEHTVLSFMDIVRSNLQNLERNIVLRHRRRNKCSKRQSKAEFYRKKYQTNVVKRSNGTSSKLESSPRDKPKGLFRLLDTIKNKIVGKDTRTATVSEIVRDKLDDHKRQFEGKSRVQIAAHFREKYAK